MAGEKQKDPVKFRPPVKSRPPKLYGNVHISRPARHILIRMSKKLYQSPQPRASRRMVQFLNLHWEESLMRDETILLPIPIPAPRRGDLDDLIFQEEGWLVSDR